jgi:hypothetical protein
MSKLHGNLLSDSKCLNYTETYRNCIFAEQDGTLSIHGIIYSKCPDYRRKHASDIVDAKLIKTIKRKRQLHHAGVVSFF